MRRLALLLVLAAAGCYSPRPLDGSFTCDSDHNFLCPAGLQCDRAAGLCVHSLANDLGAPDLVSPYDLTPVPQAPTCDDLVRAGDFANLTNLGVVNTAGDEAALTVSTDGTRLYYLDASGALQTATLSGKSASAPQAVSCSGGLPSALTGGTITQDGKYWFTGANGANSSLYVAAFTSPTQLGAPVAHSPASMGCAISSPFFVQGDPTSELYVAYPLGGCNTGLSMIAQGNADKNIGAFIGAVAEKGVQSPTLTPSGLTLLMATTGGNGRLEYATRASSNDQWHGPNAIPLAQSIGAPAHRDVQAVVSGDCKTLFLVADRAGTKGGLDLWAADIVAP